MTSATPPDNQSKDDVPLEDIDRLLAEEDPDFAKSLEEVRSVEIDSSVVIEAGAIDETMVGDDAGSAEGAGFIRSHLNKFRAAVVAFRLSFKSRMIQFAKTSLLWVKVRPKEYALFTMAIGLVAFKKVKPPVKAFREAPRLFQIGVVLFTAVVVGALWVFAANLKGIWIPHLTEPILANLEEKADYVGTFDPKDGAESFYAAFPQEVHEFLFKKMKVNLRRRPENPNPMGAFEIVVEVDSKDTAVELRDREVEFHDMLQRLMEDESVTDLDSENGKKILKGRVKKELNAKLTQGWLKDVHFKTFVLKP